MEKFILYFCLIWRNNQGGRSLHSFKINIVCNKVERKEGDGIDMTGGWLSVDPPPAIPNPRVEESKFVSLADVFIRVATQGKRGFQEGLDEIFIENIIPED